MEKTVLSFENVTGRNRGFHLNQISFALKAGYICGLVGENGAGKTTLMRYILEENAVYEGRICVDGEDICGNHVRVLNRTGFVSEDNHFLEECTCGQNAEFLGGFYDAFDRKKWRDAMSAMGLSTGKIYGRMSRGEKLKFQLAFSMAHSPSLYLIDEATAGMDPVFRKDFFRILQQVILGESASVLMSSHNFTEIEEKTDYVGVMEMGRLKAFGESLDIMPGLAGDDAGTGGKSCGAGSERGGRYETVAGGQSSHDTGVERDSRYGSVPEGQSCDRAGAERGNGHGA